MKADTILDYALFQLDPTRSRCELWISAGSETEKLATGLFKPFLAQLRVAQQQMEAGANSVKLYPLSWSNESIVNKFQWFSKGTMERFVRFVSTPEVLERAFIVEAEKNRIKEILSIIAVDPLHVGRQSATTSATIEATGLSEVHAFHQMISQYPRQSVKEALFKGLDNVGDNAKRQFMKVMHSRQHMVEKAQDMILHQAASAGFDMDHMPDLLVFADCFGAVRLRDACLEFISLLKECQDDCFCLSELDFEVAIHSALGMTATEKSRHLEYIEDNLLYSNNCKNNLIQMAHEGCGAQSAQNLVSHIPLLSESVSTEDAPSKAVDSCHDTVAFVALDSHQLNNSDELESSLESTSAYNESMVRKPYESVLTLSGNDYHLALEECKSQSIPVFGADANFSCLMGDAVKHEKQEGADLVPRGLPKDAPMDRIDGIASILNLTSNEFIFKEPSFEEHHLENCMEAQSRALNFIQLDSEVLKSKNYTGRPTSPRRRFSSQMRRFVLRSSSIRCSDLVLCKTNKLSDCREETSCKIKYRRTEEAYEDFLFDSDNDRATYREDADEQGSESASHFEVASFISEREQQNLTLLLEENFKPQKTLSWSVDQEVDKSNGQVFEASEGGQRVEFLATTNQECVTDPIDLQPEMQSYQLMAEGLDQSGERVQDYLCTNSLKDSFIVSKNHTGTGSVDMDMRSFLCMTPDASFKKELLSTSNNNYPAEEEGRLYEQYCEHRDAKLRQESALKKAERRAKLEALQEVLERGKAEMVSRRIPLVEKQYLSLVEGSHARNLSGESQLVSQKVELDDYTQNAPTSMRTVSPAATPQILNHQTSNSKSISARKVSPNLTSTSRSPLQGLVSCSPKPVAKSSNQNESLSEHQSSITGSAPKVAEKTSNRSVPGCSKRSRKENTKPYPGRRGQLSQQDKVTFPKGNRSKVGISASRRRPGNAIFPLESNSLLSPDSIVQTSASVEDKKHRISPARNRISAVTATKGMQASVHRNYNSEPLKLKNIKSQSNPQSKAYKVSLTLSVSKNAKPFLRKGRGIGPGAGPGVLKLKASLASDSVQIHSEEQLQSSDALLHDAETMTTCKIEEHAGLQSADNLKQTEFFQSSSETICNSFSAAERQSHISNDASLEKKISNNIDNLHLSLPCADILENIQDDISSIGNPSENCRQFDNMQFNCSTSHAAPKTLFSSSSSKSTLEKHFFEDDNDATPFILPNTSQPKPENVVEIVSAGSPTSYARTTCGMLCYKFSAQSVMSDAAQLRENSGVCNNPPAPDCTKRSRRLSNGLKFLRFRKKKPNSQNGPSKLGSVCTLSGVTSGARPGEYGCTGTGNIGIKSACQMDNLERTAEALAKASSAAKPAHWSLFSVLVCRSKSTDSRSR
ncbi:hypothetical protein O6H91_09G095200 [Diphasiastrum complanatum]|uniref:Uncharacterized protein n=1 Tax=Diphasiastrum complanatum TaxID=34168 RepID=A0ACC2CS08_DIPCM|nr:hypothetical protein O6H91_09G095200 [Diphasiastrum complanatum]